jgi:hypothetical protein
LQLRELDILDTRSGNPYQIPTWRHHVPQQADRLAHPASRPVPLDRPADPPADREATSADGFPIGQVTQHQQRVGVTCALLAHLSEARFILYAVAAIQIGIPAGGRARAITNYEFAIRNS